MPELPCREQIVAAVLARLQTVADVAVERDRPIPLRAEQCPRIVLREADETAETVYTGEDAFQLTVDVEGYVVGADGAAALAVIRADVDRVLLSDFTLGGLVRNLRPSDEPHDPFLDFEGTTLGKAFVRTYTLSYATQEANPYVFA